MSLDINLYAEFLLHVRSATVFATIRKESSTYKEAYVYADQKCIRITYDGNTSALALPLGIKLKGSIGFPVSDPAEISVRLEVVEEGLPSHGSLLEVANDSPWSASYFTPQTQVACKGCCSLLVPARKRNWKDLPRGSWAESLDHWYCHRPANEVDSQYLGTTGPTVEAASAFVDACHLLFPPTETLNLEVSQLIRSATLCSFPATDSKKENRSGVAGRSH